MLDEFFMAIIMPLRIFGHCVFFVYITTVVQKGSFKITTFFAFINPSGNYKTSWCIMINQ